LLSLNTIYSTVPPRQAIDSLIEWLQRKGSLPSEMLLELDLSRIRSPMQYLTCQYQSTNSDNQLDLPEARISTPANISHQLDHIE
jgi:hypothetical protein